jgi:hypothetical protein
VTCGISSSIVVAVNCHQQLDVLVPREEERKREERGIIDKQGETDT